MVASSAARAALLVLAASAPAAWAQLPALEADAGLTVSGVSAGGFMAVQLHVAHSRDVQGAAALGAGPYYCAQGSALAALRNCRTPGASAPLPAPALLSRQAQALERAGAIDPLAGVRGARVWLFSGAQDRVVVPQVGQALEQFYRGLGAQVRAVYDVPAGHGMVTAGSGGACGASAAPFINDCAYDAAGTLLAHLLGAPRAARATGGELVAFDQAQFLSAVPAALSLGERGFAYVPRRCRDERCGVHVALHGCAQSHEVAGERFVRDAGYNSAADAHGVVVLYPQAAARHGWDARAGNAIVNPHGCWDWWGYTGAQYHTKNAPQIRAIMAMVARLRGARGR